MNRSYQLLLCLLLGAALLPGRVDAQGPEEDLFGAELPDAAAGMATYREHCEDCHGPDGRGKGSMSDRLPAPPPSFADPELVGRRRPIDALTIIRDGRLEKLMPPWKGSLSAAEREAALYAAWSFSYSPERLLAARPAWESSCASCHTGAEAAAASAETALSRVWWRTRSLADAQTAMAGMPAHSGIDPRSPSTLQALTYARSFSFAPILPPGLVAEGSIAGRVVNGSQGSGGPAGAVVSLVPFHEAVPGVLPSQPLTRTVTADGAFSFQGLLAGPGMRYHLVTHYKGADAIHPLPLDLGGQAPLSAVQDTEVWEPDPNAPARVTLAQWVLAPLPEEGLIHVVEAWSLSNDSDRALVGAAGGPTLRFQLPPTARDLSFEDPTLQALAKVSEGQVEFAQPWPPGERSILFSYALPYAGRDLTLSFKAPLPTDRFDLLVVDEATAVEGKGMGPTRRETRNERQVSLSSAEALPVAEPLELRLAGLPAPSGDSPPAALRLRPWGPSMGLGSGLGLGLAALAALAMLFIALPNRAGAGAALAYDRAVAAIARLDAAREAGEIDEANYRRQRADWVAQALRTAAADNRPEAGGSQER